jgi:hypothetical protein
MRYTNVKILIDLISKQPITNNFKMKKVIISAILAVAAIFNSSAQSTTTVGVGFAPLGAIQYTVKYAHQFEDSKLQLGAFGAYSNYTQSGILNSKVSYNTTSYGVLGRYVFNDNTFQPYVGLSVGISDVTTEVTISSTTTSANLTSVFYNPHVGFNYFLNDNFNLFIEGGFGSTYVSAGVGTRF